MRLRTPARALPGNRSLLLLLLFVLAVVVLLPMTARGQAGTPQGLYYYFQGQPIPLAVSADTVAVRLVPGATVGKDLATFRTLGGGYQLVRLTGASDTLDQPGIALTAPVVEVAGVKALLTDQILVRFRPEATPEQVQSTLLGFTEIPREYPVERSHLLQVSTRSGVDALTQANRLALLPFVQYAEPNFLILSSDAQESAGQGASEQLASRAVPAGQSVNSKGAATWTTILDEDFSKPFPGGNGWTVTGDPTWARVGLSETEIRLWPGAGGTAGVPYKDGTPTNLDARITYGPFDLSDATFARVMLRLDEENSAWEGTDELSVLYSTDGVTFTEAAKAESETYGLSLNLNQAPGPVGSGDQAVADLRGQAQVWLQIRYVTGDPAGQVGPFLKRVLITKSTRAGDAISNDPLSNLQWHLNNVGQTGGAAGADIHAVEAWGRTAVDPDLVVAVIDSGVDLTHEDLNLVPGFDASGGGSQGGPGPNRGHGTSCAGLIGAIGNNGLGVIGVAPGVKIMPVRIQDDAGDFVAVADIAEGIRWAYDHGARVLSNSWGGFVPSTEIHEAVMDAKTNGAVVLVASGNVQGLGIAYPAAFPEAIAVGSSNTCDGPKRVDDQSMVLYGHCTGPELSVVAPGVSMVTTDLMGAQGYSPGNYTANFGGTSSACPVAAGVVALMLSEHPGLTVDEVRDLLQRTADDIENVQLVAEHVDDLVGHGRVNADAAVLAVETKLAMGGAGVAGLNAGLGDGSGGGCFIATAAYGSAFHPQVAALRQFRDQHLLTNAPGRALTALYYRLSPPLAVYIKDRPAMRAAVRVGLTPVVAAVEYPLPALGLLLALALVARRARRR